MKIYFVRHGESVNNVIEENNPEEYYYLRVADPELTALGISQALTLKEKFKSIKIDKGEWYAVLSSPMFRCLQTSDLIFKDSGVPVEVRPNLYEVQGMWNLEEIFPGLNQHEILRMFPDFNANKVSDQGYYFLNARETNEQAWIRAESIIEELKTLECESVCVIIHGLLLNILIGIFFGENIKNSKYYVDQHRIFHNCRISLVEWNGSEFSIVYVNS